MRLILTLDHGQQSGGTVFASKMKQRKHQTRAAFSRVVMVAAILLLPPLASSTTAANTPPNAFDHGHVYLVRGLGNIFSLGMDQLSNRLRAVGVTTTVSNHLTWQGHADEIAAEYLTNPRLAPIIIIGHSLGGNAALGMARHLARNGVPVRLLVIFDATADIPVAANVAEVINLYKRGRGAELAGMPGFRGTIVNDDLTGRINAGHMNIDENRDLHDLVVAKVIKVLGEPAARMVSPRLPQRYVPLPRTRPSGASVAR